ncbi:hypothetical protein PshuTeo1_38330 [Pseudomonas hunanensis]|nr:hypothetical protein PshuTeo1_38330 [Pseudomonas hunanensis]
MKNYESVQLPRELAERIARLCMFTMLPQDSQALRAILARPESYQLTTTSDTANQFKLSQPSSIFSIVDNGELLGRMYRDEDGKLIFEGDADASALAFIEALKPHFTVDVDRLRAERDQLQADLTARDDQNDKMRVLLQHLVYDYRAAIQAGYDKITALGGDCDSISKMLADNPNYQKAMALLLPDLESRPEERGTPEAEPCSGCGTPGYTGTCAKCVPY